MRRKIPSTTALAAFESAARHQSFTRAADELALTQSAVCRQIASLEAFVGVKLFRRSQRGVILTEAGQRYSDTVRSRLDEVERDTLALMAAGSAGGSLELGVVATFATKWLLPRLPEFQRQHPGISIHLHSRPRPFLFEGSGLDAAIHPSSGPWPGTEALMLLPETLIAVASPRLIGASPRPMSADQLADLPLLQISTRPYAWRQWFERFGLRVDHALAGTRMELYSMVIEGAVQGLGMALVPSVLVEGELARGDLVPVLQPALRGDPSTKPMRSSAPQHDQHSGLHYALIYPENKSDLPALQAFKQWLATQTGPIQPAG